MTARFCIFAANENVKMTLVGRYIFVMENVLLFVQRFQCDQIWRNSTSLTKSLAIFRV